MDRLQEIEARLAAIVKELDTPSADIDALEKEVNDLKNERKALTDKAEKRRALLSGIAEGRTGRPIAPTGLDNPMLRSYSPEVSALADLQGIEADKVVERSRQFAESPSMRVMSGALKRSLTLSGGTIAQPTRVSGINQLQNTVSGIIDMVFVVDADGMGGDKVAYETTAMTAGVKADNGAATSETSPGFAFANLPPVLITTLGYISRNIERTTPLNYQQRTTDAALRALRTKISKLILTGNPGASPAEITGILKAGAIENATDITIAAIDATTLRKIALNYGGAVNVEGGGCLCLSKTDLIAFGDIRGTNEKKAVYEIVFDENSTTTGKIIDGGLAVAFCLNDDLTALSAASAGDYCMAYGKPMAYQLDLFGPYDIQVSRDYKFAEGLLAVMGEVMVGGNVVVQNGFVRVKKAGS